MPQTTGTGAEGATTTGTGPMVSAGLVSLAAWRSILFGDFSPPEIAPPISNPAAKSQRENACDGRNTDEEGTGIQRHGMPPLRKRGSGAAVPRASGELANQRWREPGVRQ